jgi:hypothetical protein
MSYPPERYLGEVGEVSAVHQAATVAAVAPGADLVAWSRLGAGYDAADPRPGGQVVGGAVTSSGVTAKSADWVGQ